MTTPQMPQIEHDIPLPVQRGGKRSHLREWLQVLSKAPVGTSMRIPDPTGQIYKRISNHALRVGQRGWYTLRREGDGHVRVWKVKDVTTPAKTGANAKRAQK